MIRDVIFDENSFGITQRSLKILRDSLAQRMNHHIAVVEVPTNDLCCGFLILDRDLNEAIFTGDGFRTDGGGEGGAGYRSAEALFSLFRIKIIPWETVNIEQIYQGDTESVRKKLLNLAEEIARTLVEKDYRKPLNMKPYYVRG